ncbi:class I SAM-dependent methyltransferase [Novosphingobium sp. 1949]|uniref:Class I SAM-dependent methyltransferase n=1 Tax=Novosphingobium organovorum TaxID=2930092 RepID=A0ABT0BI28_9SPHN|nr:class I SAM-dependent methyltransferase [Novosphingobium organovorum]MCJ2184723.1 class I SAM-dependent methyltransferase [Novosphingobium organovorum]
MGWIEKALMRANRWHFVHSYRTIIAREKRKHPQDRERALMGAIGAASRADFAAQGDAQVAVLRHHGLSDGMAVYDLGCGIGRTAQALLRDGWRGRYTGADILPELVDHLRAQCPGFTAIVQRKLAIAAPDATLDMVFHWSVFTHLYPEECFLYLQDIHRALKPGGRLIFSFLEFEDPAHHTVFQTRTANFAVNGWSSVLDSFLHRDWITLWARQIGFAPPRFTSGSDTADHPAFWQSLAVLDKPAPA